MIQIWLVARSDCLVNGSSTKRTTGNKVKHMVLVKTPQKAGYYDRNVRSTNCVSCSFDRYINVLEITVCTSLMDSPSQTDAFLE